MKTRIIKVGPYWLDLAELRFLEIWRTNPGLTNEQIMKKVDDWIDGTEDE